MIVVPVPFLAGEVFPDNFQYLFMLVTMSFDMVKQLLEIELALAFRVGVGNICHFPLVILTAWSLGHPFEGL